MNLCKTSGPRKDMRSALTGGPASYRSPWSGGRSAPLPNPPRRKAKTLLGMVEVGQAVSANDVEQRPIEQKPGLRRFQYPRWGKHTSRASKGQRTMPNKGKGEMGRFALCVFGEVSASLPKADRLCPENPAYSAPLPRSCPGSSSCSCFSVVMASSAVCASATTADSTRCRILASTSGECFRRMSCHRFAIEPFFSTAGRECRVAGRASVHNCVLYPRTV